MQRCKVQRCCKATGLGFKGSGFRLEAAGWGVRGSRASNPKPMADRIRPFMVEGFVAFCQVQGWGLRMYGMRSLLILLRI